MSDHLDGTEVIEGHLWRVVLGAAGALFGLLAPQTAEAAEPAPPGPEKEPGIRVTADVRYVPGRDRQTLDVIAPEGARNAPVVLFVHGGAWMIGDKNLFGLYREAGRFLARHGVVAVLINYRLSPKVKHPGHVEDVAGAYAWVRRHVADYGGDPDTIFLCGHSAGGHLVSLLATDERYLKDLKLGPADLRALRGVISVSGVYVVPGPDDFVKLAEQMLNTLLAEDGNGGMMVQLPPWVRNSPLMNPFRSVFGTDPAALRDASPLYHVRKGLPPFLVLYAEHDLPMLADQAEAFGKALADAGDAVEVRQIEGRNHNSILFHIGRRDDPAGKAVLGFIHKYAAARP
jgi:acetyl esterase/lipase